jgi:integrase
MTNKDEPQPGRIKVGDHVTISQRGMRRTWTAEFSDRGVHRRISLRTRNLKIARNRALKLETQLADGAFRPKAKPVGIAQAVNDYLATKKSEDRSPNTLRKYRTALKAFESLAARHGIQILQQISARLFDLYRAAQQEGRDEWTRYTEAIIIKGFVKWCASRGLTNEDPLRFCRVSKPPPVRKMAPTLEQVDSLLNEAGAQEQIELAVAAFTGIRAGELRMLRPEDVGGGWIQVAARVGWAPKNRQSRKVPIHPRLRAYLDHLPKNDRPYLFCAPPSKEYPEGGHQISTKHLNEFVQRLARQLKMPTGRKSDGLVAHSLRHFFETHCVNAGIPQRVIDAWMGHTGDRSMGGVYYRLGDKESQSFMDRVPF